MKNQVALTLTTQDTSEIAFFEIGDSYSMIQKAVSGWIECVRLNNGVDMWVNEEGKILDLPYNPTATAIFWANFGFMSDVIVGNVIFTSSNDEGDTIGLNVSQVEYLKEIAFDIVGIKPQLPFAVS